MGFFNNIRNFVSGSIEKEEQQSDYDRQEAIDYLKQNKELANNIPILSLLDSHAQYPQIYFGNKNASPNIYHSFLIPESEIIVAYIKGKTSIFGAPTEKAVITNKELYILLSVSGCDKFRPADDKSTYHYPLSDFCKYFILISNDQCFFENEDGQFTLIKKPVITAALSQNLAEESFYNMLKKMQDSLYQNSEQAKNDRENLFQWLTRLSYNQIIDGTLEAHTKELIQIIGEEAPFKYKSKLLLLQEPLYYYDCAEVANSIHQFSEEMDINAQKNFLDRFDYMLNQFLEIAKRTDTLQNSKYLAKLKIQLSFFVEPNVTSLMGNSDFEKNAMETFNKYRYSIGVFLALKKYPDISVTDVSASLKKHNIDEKTHENILKYLFSLRDKRMLGVFNNIKNQEPTFPKEWLSYTDSCGLTPLHYSLILRNDATTTLLLNNLNKLHPFSDNLNDNLKKIYNYAVLCIFTGRKEYLVPLAEYYKDDDIKPFITNKHLLEAILKAKEFALDQTINALRTLDKNIRDAQRSKNYSETQLENAHDKSEQLHNLEKNLRETIKNTKADIREVEDAIISFMWLKYSPICDQITQEHTDADKLFHKIFMSAETLYTCINSLPEEREFISIYNVKFFVNKILLHFDDCKKESYDSRQSQRKQKNVSDFTSEDTPKDIHIVKPYGDKWFSDSAYENMTILGSVK